MGNPLQDRRAPQELAASRQVIEIASKISDFEQLAEIIATDLSALDPDKLPPDWRDASVAGRLSFGFAGAQGATPALTGQVAVTISAVCQRCLQPFLLPLQADLRLLFDDNAAAGEEGYEVWELDEENVRPAELIEEALIMTIPFVAMHVDDVNCASKDAAIDDSAKMTMPFANLKSQMERED